MYCQKCGALIHDEAVICVKCGCAVNGDYDLAQASPKSYRNLIDTITQRIHINGIIWVVIAVIQIVLGLAYNWILLIIGGLNIASAIMDLNYSKQIKSNPVGIVKRVKPLAGAIIVLIYNLLIGGVVGIVGSIYYLVGVRNYVMENEKSFLEIEKRYNAKKNATNASETRQITTGRTTEMRPAGSLAQPTSSRTSVSTTRNSTSRTIYK